jgi:ATP-dependent Lhr-like helicase
MENVVTQERTLVNRQSTRLTMPDVLAAFLPATQEWFLEAFGQPTEPQSLGWPAIQRGEHTLILSPTGSGKTLAAFLWGVDQLYREIQAEGSSAEEGVRLLYVSPLKALNNDVERNLRTPLAGIRRAAEALGAPLPRLEVLVRTGDTPQSARRRMVKHPPHILITTPESLYLILTSPVARDMFRRLHTIIVDEIHTLVSNKRGVHLAVSLERAVELAEGPIQRIGLSATQRPLEEVARFLGGYTPGVGNSGSADSEYEARPVTIVDAGMVKPMDLKVVTAAEEFRDLPGGSIWPAVIPRVMDLVAAHRTTLIFANSRRQAERTADRLNELWMSHQAGTGQGAEALTEGGTAKGIGFSGTGAVGGPFRAHHGSVSREARLHLEQALKEGRLPALVGTSSLELGIDIGSVDLVIQIQSPKGVARSLQRVGRSGHLVGQTSVGRFFPTHREDLLESAAIARAMRQGDVEPSSTPQNSLDVLAQQVVAMVSVQDWDAEALYRLVRRAYPYHRLTPQLFRSVLDMLSGRYPSSGFRELRPRIAWDRVHNRLAALPGSRLLAIRNGGTIPDRGTFGAYLPDRKTKLGELDEEFVFETRPGDVFTLGANTWRVQEVSEDRIVVIPAPGHLPRMPFWRGDAPRRDYHLGCLYGRFRRELAERLARDDEAQVIDWLRSEHCLDLISARSAIGYVRRQVEVLGTISSDRTIVAELFPDPLGDLRLVIHSPLGARVNSPWALALASAFREAMAPGPGLQGPQPEVMVSDDGILFRFVDADRPPPLALIREMGPAEARERLLAELPHSALFGAQFRVNAARALLLPAARGRQKRTPFWLQRLRAKDLLAVAREFEDFPIIAETYRDCLRDVLDLAHLEEVLGAIQAGEVEVVTVETVVPSPVAASLLHDLIAQYMYEGDQPKAERQMQALMVGRDMLAQLLDEAALPDLLRPEAVREVDEQLQRRADGSRARSADELATVFLALGDLTAEEAAARADGPVHDWLEDLVRQGRLVTIELASQTRYVLAEHLASYRHAFRLEGEAGPEVGPEGGNARRAILRRVLSTHGPLTRDWLLARYPWDAGWLDGALEVLVESGEVVVGQITPSPPPSLPASASTSIRIPQSTEPPTQYCDRRNLERIHRRTLALLRKEVEPVSLYAYADFLARWQHLHPAHRLSGPGALVRLLQQMRGVPAPGAIWERDLLPGRLEAYDPAELEALCAQGEVVWVASGGVDPRRARVRFLFRGEGGLFLPGEAAEKDISAGEDNLSLGAAKVLAFLKAEGASFFADLQAGLALDADEEGEGMEAGALASALVELVLAGLVTNDSLHALRQVLAWSEEAGGSERQPLSTLEAELAAWRRSRPAAPPAAGTTQEGPVGWLRRPDRARLHRAQRDVSRRLAGTSSPVRAVALPGGWPGRWSLVHRIGVWGREVPTEERIARQARQLLQCYGIVTRQSLEADPEGSWDWGALYRQFQLMEMRGEVRRGYFVQGLPGVQFALPEAVERLREWTQPQAPGSDALVRANATDPANLFGPAGGPPASGEPASGIPEAGGPAAGGPASGEPVPGPDPARFVRIPANYVTLLRGRPVLLLEAGGARLTSLPDLPRETAKQALRLAVEGAAAERRRLTVVEWNGEAVLDSPLAPLLEEVGFRREMLVYVRD